MRDKCECAGIGRQARLRGVCFTTYGFKSRHSHHRKDLIPWVSSLFYFMQASDDGTWGSLATAACGGKREQSAVWNNEQKEHIYVQRIATIFQTGELGSLLQIKLDFAIFICFVIIIMYVLLSAWERGFPLQIIHNIHYIKTFLSNIRFHQACVRWASLRFVLFF